jgi:hypothetical protein
MSSEERRHRDESFNDVFGAWLGDSIVSKRSLHKLNLQAASSHRPIPFDPEGSSLDRCVPVNNPGYRSIQSKPRGLCYASANRDRGKDWLIHASPEPLPER